MGKKTVFKRASKWIPLSPELRENLEKDDEPILTEQERFKTAKPIFAEKPKKEEGKGVEPEAEEKADTGDSEAKEEPSINHLEEIRAELEKRGISDAKLESLLRRKHVIGVSETLDSLSEDKIAEITVNLFDYLNEIE